MTLRNLVLFVVVLTIATAHAFEVPNGIKELNRLKRQTLVGGEELKDPNDAKFKKLAQESIEKYSQNNPGGEINVKEIKVTKVTKQVVSGSLTRLTFTVEPTNGEQFTCHSKIWEQPWLNKKDITIDCDIKQQKPKVKRQVPGGEVEKDPKDQQYKKLAEESVEKFGKTNPGGPISVKEIEVTKVTYQVVSGSLTRLTFTVEPKNGEKFTCHSKIWEQPWLNKKDITVDCDINQQKPKVKRQVPGGEVEKDPKDQQYKILAEESLEKFGKTNPGGPISVKEIEVTKVTYQVVSGSLTRLTFTVEPKNGEKFTCHSKIWEQPWLNKKDITVDCDINQQKSKVKREVLGDQVEKDPNYQQ